jgi:hypothetical protein
MRFSAGWFKKLYSFAGTRKAELSEEESGSSRKEMAADEELVAKKPNLRMRLMGLFKREKTGLPVDEESSGQDEPQNELEVQQEVEASDGHFEQKDTEETPSKNLWTRLCAVFKRKSNEQAAADLADAAELFSRVEDGSQAATPAKRKTEKTEKGLEEDGAGQVDVSPKPGFFGRFIGIFRRKKKVGATEEDTEVRSGAEGEQVEGNIGASETPKNNLWTGLRSVFKRKSKEQSAVDLADAAELIPGGEGKSARVGKGRDDESVEGGEEEQPPTGLGARIGALVRKKIIWIPLLLVIIGSIAFVVSLKLSELRALERTQMLELEKKNKQLQEENKKLQALKKKTVIQPSKALGAPSQNKPAGSADAARQDSSDDCTINNKASAAEVLKRCIESFNATDQRGSAKVP